MSAECGRNILHNMRHSRAKLAVGALAVLTVALLCALPSTAAASLGDAVDAPALTWETHGNSPWTEQGAVSHDGVDAAKSGPMADYSGGYSGIRTTVTGPGQLRFWVSVDAYFTHYGVFKVDGVQQDLRYWGQFSWTQLLYDIPAGEHTLSWEYHKDFMYSGSYADCMYLDQVQWSPTAPPSGSMVVNNDDATTSSRYVNLDSAVTGATEMRFRDSGGSWTPWESYVADKPWTLPAGDGIKTVEAEYRNAHGFVQYSDAITLSSTAGTVVYVNALTGLDVPPGDGSLANPFKSVTKGMEAVPTGGIVEVSTGTYDAVSTGEVFPATFKSGVTLRGQGVGATSIIAKTGSVYAPVAAFSAIDVALEDLTLGGTDMQQGGLVFENSTGRVSNCSFESCVGFGLRAYQSTVTVDSSELNACARGLWLDDVTLDVTASEITSCSRGIDTLGTARGSRISVAGTTITGCSDVGVYDAGTGAQITLTDTAVTHGGEGIQAYSADTTVTGCTLSNNRLHGLYAEAVNPVIIENTVVESNAGSSGPDAAVEIRGGGLAASNCTVTANGTVANGISGIYVNGNVPVSLDGCDVTSNAGDGLVAVSASSDPVEITGCTVSDNDRIGVHTNGPGATITSSTFARNGGGGVYAISGVFWIRNTAFTSNRQLGGLNVASSSAATQSVEDCTFYDNVGDIGGGISWGGTSESTGKLIVARTTIESNTAQSGGGLAFSYGNLSAVDCTFTSNSAQGGGYGGGISLISHASAQVDRTTIHGNHASRRGGGIYAGDCALGLLNTTLTANTAVEEGGNVGAWQGAVTVPLRVSGCVVSQGVGGDGGGLYVYGGQAEIDSTTFDTNISVAGGGGGTGGIRMVDVTATLSDCTVTASTGAAGGGMYLSPSGKAVLIENCTIASNTATDSGAGGLKLVGADATVRDTTITANYATGPSYARAGGILAQNTLLHLERCAITSNTSAGTAGGVSVSGQDLEMSDCTVGANTAAYDGGGLYAESCNSTVTASAIDANASGQSGGGVYSGGDNGRLVIDRCTVTDNDCASSGGGMIVRGNNVFVHVNGSTIAQNSAATAGGMLSEVSGTSSVIEHSAFTGNAATTDAYGGLSTLDPSGLVHACVFSGNSGPVASALRARGGTVQDCLFTGNAVTSAGGADGTVASDVSAVTLSGCTITGNIGAGLGVNGNPVNVDSSVLWDNTGDEIAGDTSQLSVTCSDVQAGWTGTGNISADPLFADAASHDYRLSADSPCVDAGDPSSTLSHDVDEVQRPQDGTGDGVSRVDMGAHERPYFSVNQGAASTSSTAVTANQSFVGASEMRFDTGSGWSVWTSYALTEPLTLPSGDGVKTVTAQFSYDTGRTMTLTDTIALDTATSPPVALDDSYTVAEDGVLAFVALGTPNPLSNDSDSDGDSISFHRYSDPQHAAVCVIYADGSGYYRPAADFVGTDHLTYRAYDGQSYSAVANITITVTPVNDVPVARADAAAVAGDTTLTVAAPGVLANDSDVEGDALHVSNYEQPAHGSVTVAADGSWRYRPAKGFAGIDHFRYMAHDTGAPSAWADVSVTVSKATTAITLSSAPQTVSYGSVYGLTGMLSSGDTLESGALLTLESSTDGVNFVASALTAATDANGAFSFSLKPSRKTWYRVQFVETVSGLGAQSDAVMIQVAPSVGAPRAPSTMSRYRYYTVYGYLKPRHTSGTYPVRIYRWRYVSGKWKPYGYVKAKASNYSTYTKFSRKIRLPYKGKWRLRAYAPADSRHVAKWSKPYDYVTVK